MSELTTQIERHRDWFVDFVRIYLGIVLILKGILFLDDMPALMEVANQEFETFAGTGFAYGTLAHFIIFANILGGVFLSIGLLTRIVVPFQLPVLLIAVMAAPLSKVYFKGGSPFEFSMLLVLLLGIFIYGGGRISVDYYLEKKRGK